VFGTIRGRSLLASVLLLALLATVSLIGVVRMSADRSVHRTLEQKTTTVLDLEEARAQFFSAGMFFATAALTNDPHPLSDSYYNAIAQGQAYLQMARDNIQAEGDPSLIADLDRAQQYTAELSSLIDSLTTTGSGNSQTPVTEYMPKLLPVANLLLDNLAQVSQAEQNSVAAEVSNANHQANLNLWMLAIIGAAGGLLAVLVLTSLIRLVVGPLASLQRGVRAVASGDLESRVDVSGPAEVASLASDFNDMVGKLNGVSEQMRQRVRLESAVARVSSVLATSNSVDGALIATLRILGETIDVEHAYVFTFNSDGTRLDNTHEWNVPGRNPTRDRFQGLDTATYCWWVGKLERNEDIVLHDLHQLPVEAEAEKELLQKMRVRSLLAVPFSNHGRLAGFIAFGDTRGPHIWHDQNVKLVRLAAESTASFIERKQAEQAVRESEERYRMLFERSPDAVYLYDFKGHFLDANDRYLQLLGYSREEMARLSFPDLWAQDYSIPVAALVDELKATGQQSEPSIFRLRRNDGTFIEVEASAAAVQRGDGPPAALGVARDVTERMQAEEALRESEERFRSLSTAVPVGIYLTDARGGTVYVNERMLAICGLSFEESMGLGWLRAVHPDDRDRVVAAKENANAESQEFAEDFRIITREGETRWVSAHSRAIGDHGGRVGALEDITDRKLAADALRQSEERFRSLGASAPIGIFQSDPTGKVTFVNDHFGEIAGFSFVENPDATWFDVIHPDDREGTITGVIEAIKERKEFSRELRLLSPYGVTRWVCARATNIRAKDGRFAGLVGTIEDITERRQAQEALRQSEARFRSLSASAPIGIFLVDGEDRVTYVNECLRAFIGKNIPEKVDAALEAIVHSEDQGPIRKAHEEAGGLPRYELSQEFRVMTAAGETRWTRVHVTPILSPEGDRTGLVGTVEDITEHKNMERERQDAYEKTTLLLARAAEARDPYTEHHLFRIRGYSVAIAQEMGLSPGIGEEIGLAALLHDLGKTRVPDAILTKPGPLTEDEWQIMRRHTLWGEKLLPHDPWFETARQITRSHHENWDGTGYPDHLAGTEIPLAATIVAVADGFDAMTSRRPYKGAWPPARAMRELRATKGKRYSPEVVEAFERAVASGAVARIAGVQRRNVSALMKAA
jgi:PAS domain S-box-containing protein